MSVKYYCWNKPLPKTRKREQQKYLILLANQTVIIDNEWSGMKKALSNGANIVEMLPTDARVNCQVTVLTKLLESLQVTKQII